LGGVKQSLLEWVKKSGFERQVVAAGSTLSTTTFPDSDSFKFPAFQPFFKNKLALILESEQARVPEN
jgi:hypothetical protein